MKIIFALLSYLLGSVPTGYLLYLVSEKKDIRGFGSQSTGATNVLRLKGWRFALPVMVFDILKGFLPAFLALKLFDDPRLAILCGFLAVLGHCFPVFIKFKGGKGVATSVGVYAVLAIKPLLVALVIFVAAIALTRFVSLGSLLATLSFPVSAFLFHYDSGTMLLCLAVFLIILFRHWGNVLRLFRGTERKLGEKVR